jgi:putative heme-binding domain-containing protein
MSALPESELVDWLGTNSSEITRHFPIATRDALTIRALQLSEPFLKKPSNALLGALRAQAEQARTQRRSPTAVDLQLVLTLGQLPGATKVELLGKFIESQFLLFKYLERLEDPEPTKQDLQWIGPALVNSLGKDAIKLVELIDPTPTGPGAPPVPRSMSILPDAWDGIIAEIARAVGARNQSNDVERIVRRARHTSFRGCASILEGLQAGFQQAGVSFEGHGATRELDQVFQKAATTATAGGLGLTLQANQRLSAIRLLGFAPYEETRSNLLWLAAGSAVLKDYRSTAMASLGRSGNKQFGADIVSVWPQLTPVLRSEALGRVFQRAAWLHSLLKAIEAGTVPSAELSVAQQAQLRSHRDPTIRQEAANVLGRAPTAARQSVVELFQPALGLKGDAANGSTIFQARCASCHKLGNEGHTLGPDLATVKSGGKDKLLIAILDPNREVAPNFASYSLDTKDGENLTGILVSENAGSVTLRLVGGAESVIARVTIASLQSQGRSLMPEGLEEGLKPQDLADLLEFIVGEK